MHDALDELLASAAPAVSPRTPDAEAALAAMVADARREAGRGRRAKVTRRAGGAAAVFALLAVGTAAAAGVLPQRPNAPVPWSGLTDKAAATAQVIEWTSVRPGGLVCVERLTGWGLTDAQLATIRGTLSDPAQLLARDDGAVRQEFLDKGWATDSAEDAAAMDDAYAAVAKLDLAAGRGTLTDDELTSDILGSRSRELYNAVYWRLIVDGVGAGPHQHGENQAMDSIDTETACEVTE